MRLLHGIEFLDPLFLQPSLEGLPTSIPFPGIGNGPKFDVENKWTCSGPPFLS